MNSSNDLTYIIDRTANIENLLDQIIVNFLCPRKEAFFFFWSVILNSSIMTLGAKVTTVMAIAQECNYKLNQNSLHSVISFRNAFAHNSTNAHPEIMVGVEPEDTEIHYTLRIVKSSGKTEVKKREHALEEFNKAFKNAKESLLPLRDITKAIVGAPLKNI